MPYQQTIDDKLKIWISAARPDLVVPGNIRQGTTTPAIDEYLAAASQEEKTALYNQILPLIPQSNNSEWVDFRDSLEAAAVPIATALGAFFGAIGGPLGSTAGAAVANKIVGNNVSQGAQENAMDPVVSAIAGGIGGIGGAGGFNSLPTGTVNSSYFGAEPIPAGTTDYLNAGNGMVDTGITGGGLTGVAGAGGSSFTMPITPTTGINQPTGNAFSGSTGSNTGYDLGLGGTEATLGAAGTDAALSELADPSLAQIVGAVAPSVLGYIGSQDIADQQAQLAREYMALGAPSRSRYEASYAPDFTMANDPGYTDALNQTSKSVLHGLSAQGNPADSPNAWAQSLSDIYQQTAYPALQNYRTTNATSGGLASAFPAGVDANNANLESQGNMWNAIGAGASSLNNIFSTPAQTSWDKYLQSITR